VKPASKAKRKQMETDKKPRITQEKRTVEIMIRLYCRKKEKNATLCPKCEAAYHRQIEDEARQQRKNYKQMSGFSGERPEGESGRRRFER
jgi:hypothetical protein